MNLTSNEYFPLTALSVHMLFCNERVKNRPILRKIERSWTNAYLGPFVFKEENNENLKWWKVK